MTLITEKTFINMETQIVKKGVLSAFKGVINDLNIKEIEDLQEEVRDKQEEIDELESEVPEEECVAPGTLTEYQTSLGTIYFFVDNLKIQQQCEAFFETLK